MIDPGQPRAFGPDYAHDVRNVSLAPAISIHAYSPPLSEMNSMSWMGFSWSRANASLVRLGHSTRSRACRARKSVDRTGGLSIERVLSAARARLLGYLK